MNPHNTWLNIDNTASKDVFGIDRNHPTWMLSYGTQNQARDFTGPI